MDRFGSTDYYFYLATHLTVYLDCDWNLSLHIHSPEDCRRERLSSIPNECDIPRMWLSTVAVHIIEGDSGEQGRCCAADG